jgi:phosphatidate cytidylyltransferase
MKPSPLLIRIGSAAVLLPFTITVVWWNPWVTAAAVAMLISVCLLEIYGAFAHAGYQPNRWLGMTMALALAGAIATDQQTGLNLTAATMAIAIIAGLIDALRHHDRKGILADWALTIAGAIYIGGLSGHIMLVRMLETPLQPGPLQSLGLTPGPGWLYFICAVTWMQDAIAYFAGKSYGRHLMTPNLSPKKTWEGAAGGMAGAILGGVLAAWICGLPIPLWAAVLLGVAGGIIGPLGDLAESMIKRQAGLKDAGSLIPGHGGLLDRVDSFIFTVPVLYYLILLAVR